MKYYVDKTKFEHEAVDLIERLELVYNEMIFELSDSTHWDELLDEIDYLLDDFTGLVNAYRETKEEEGGKN